MKKNLLLTTLLGLVLGNVKAQIGMKLGTQFGTKTPSAILDLSGTTNQGLLIPRINLLATNNYTPLSGTPLAGMLVYNQATAGTPPNDVTPGFYYHNGTIWVKVGIDQPIYTGSTSVALNGTSFERAALTGDATAAANNNTVTVTGIQGRPVVNTAPTSGQAIAWNGTSWAPTTITTTEVDGVIGNEVLNATTNGGLVRSGLGTGVSPFTLGITPGTTTGQVVKWNGTSWAPGADDNTTYMGSTSVVLNGTSFERAALTGDATAAANNNTVTVTGLQGRSVASTAPFSGQVLTWDGSAWTPSLPPVVTQSNIYNSDGTLTGNRIVTQGASSLTFTGTGNTILNSGNVGIGTSSPSTRFHLVGVSRLDGRMTIHSSDGNSGGEITTTGEAATENGIVISSIRGGGKIVFNTNDGFGLLERMRITRFGLVGIGTNSPGELLDVAGNIRFFGALMPGGVSGTIGQVLVSNGSNNIPTWVNQSALSSVNIYNANGNLNGDRLVGLNGNNLTFGGNGNMAFGGNPLSGSRFTFHGGVNYTNGSTDTFPSQGTYLNWNNNSVGLGTNGQPGGGYTGIVNHRGTGEGGIILAGTGGTGSTITQWLRIAGTTGNVAIGSMINPSVKLDVDGDISFRGSLLINDSNNNGAGSLTTVGTTGNVAIVIESARGGAGAGVRFNTNNGTAIAERMYLNNSGLLGIGVAAPTNILHINGQGRATNSAWATTSDMRIKENIVNYTKGLNELMQIRPVEYNFKPNVENMSPEEKAKRRVGILAQEIEQVLPKTVTLVKENGLEDQRVFSSDELLYLLINSVKELKKTVDEQAKALNAAIKELESIKSNR